MSTLRNRPKLALGVRIGLAFLLYVIAVSLIDRATEDHSWSIALANGLLRGVITFAVFALFFTYRARRQRRKR